MSLRQDLNVPVRIAIVQLECHQAATIGGRDFLGEPFVDQHLLPLDHLIATGLTQLKTTRKECKEKYIAWHRERVMATLRYIQAQGSRSSLWETPTERNVVLSQRETERESLDTGSGDVPVTHLQPFLLIVFPEYSIPFELLNDIKEWADQYMSQPESLSLVIFAGTHSLPARTEEVDKVYKHFHFETTHNGHSTTTDGSPKTDVDFAYSAELPSKSVCPILYWDKSEKKIRGRLKLKRVLSPFELTNMGAHTFHPKDLYDEDLLSVPLNTRWVANGECGATDANGLVETSESSDCSNLKMTFLPLICSEALQAETFGGERSFDIAVIPSYNKKAEAFDSIIEQISLNQHLVVLCNDGRYGGSRFAIPPSHRGEGWWLGHPNGGSLPIGDSVIIADVTPLNLAEVSGVNNPSERVQLQRISAVVPSNTAHDGFIVRQCLRTLKRRELSKKQNAAERVDHLEVRRSVLTETLDLRDATLLQRRKLERLLSLGPIDQAVWKLHGDDVVFPFPSQHPRSEVDIIGFERKLVAICMERIENLRVANHLTPKQHQYVTSVAEMLRNHPFRRGELPEPGPSDLITRSVWKFLRRTSEQSEHDARQFLTTTVAEIVERYHAASAWLLIHVPRRRIASRLKPIRNLRPLVCAVAHNAVVPPPLGLHDCMAGSCVKSVEPMLHPRIVQRYGQTQLKQFLPLKKSSRSAIAVPIVCDRTPDHDGDHVTGVLVLESSDHFAFSWADAEELMVEAKGLSAALLFLKAAQSDVHKYYAWYPVSSGWDLSLPLNDLCYSVGTSIPNRLRYPGLGMTIWHSRFKDKHAFALGAFRFDADYISQRVLPTYQTDEFGQFHEVSFIGSVLAEQTGYTTARNWRELGLFRRQDKARRTEIDEVFATNLRGTASERTDFGDGPVSKAQNLQRHLGAISWYTYGGSTDALRPHMEAPFLRATASIIDRFIYTNTETMRVSACAALEHLLEHLTITGVNTFNVIRKFLVEVFNVDGCSIFAVRNQAGEGVTRKSVALTSVTTSGLTRFGKDLLSEQASYDKLKEDSPHLTVKVLFNANPESRCENCRQLGAMRESPPPARLLDTFVLTEFEHRRSLIQAVTVPDDALPQIKIDGWTDNTEEGEKRNRVGVIRLIRSTRGRPFTSYDQELLKDIATLIWPAFVQLHQWYRDSRVDKESKGHRDTKAGRATERIDQMTRRALVAEANAASNVKGDFADNQSKPSVEPAARLGSIRNALKRLLVLSNGFGSWNRIRVESIVQDLFFAFDARRPVLSMFRIIVRHWSGTPAMLIHSFHGHSFMELSEEAAAEPLLETEGGVGWCAIKDMSLIEFDKSDPEFTTAFDKCQEMTKRGLCLPIVLPFRRGPMIGVLSIEVGEAEERAEGKEGIGEPFSIDEKAVMFAAARKISSLAAGDLTNQSPVGVKAASVAKIVHTIKSHLLSAEYKLDIAIAEESERWEFGILLNAISNKEDSDRESDLTSFANDIDTNEYHPLNQLRWFVDRSTLDPDRPELPGKIPRAFGRTPAELEAELFGMQSIGVRVDFCNGRFRLPLWVGGAEAGVLIGISGTPIIPGFTDGAKRKCAIDRAMAICGMIRESLWIWSRISLSPGFLIGDWGVNIVEQRESIPGRRTWSPLCVWGGDWLQESKRANSD